MKFVTFFLKKKQIKNISFSILSLYNKNNNNNKFNKKIQQKKQQKSSPMHSHSLLKDGANVALGLGAALEVLGALAAARELLALLGGNRRQLLLLDHALGVGVGRVAHVGLRAHKQDRRIGSMVSDLRHPLFRNVIKRRLERDWSDLKD